MSDLLDPSLPSEPAAAMAGLIADLQRSNPPLAALAQWMQQRAVPPAAASAAASAAAADDHEAAELARRLVEAEARIADLKRQGRRLFENYRLATDRLSELAAALGACALCWGDDPACPNCRGRGRPGMVRPDPELRARLLGPPRAAAAAAAASPVIRNQEGPHPC
ncbi:MAG: hypothetical protein INR65_03230 [Gluconacetobacter diazotrophicus]|nr:hypothetical protein [Gluconacetobacter diazotrophicus]